VQGPFAATPTTGGSLSQPRLIASLRLARLRISAGIAKGDDLTIGQTIATSEMSDELIGHEIATLSLVKMPEQNVPVQRQAVTAARAVPSLAPTFAPSMSPEAPNTTPLARTAAVSDDEMIFE
jgi:hypothetical protein